MITVTEDRSGQIRTPRPNPQRLGLWRMAGLALAAWRQRRALANLPAERLKDLGLSERDVRLETQKPVWNVPVHWLR